jgi:hypothetical protein
MIFLAGLFSKAFKESSLDSSNFVVPTFDIPCFAAIKVVHDTVVLSTMVTSPTALRIHGTTG